MPYAERAGSSKRMDDPNLSTTHLLWTGGWDSTFRLLQCLLVLEKMVQPHYLIDARRPSTGFEILAMNSIRQRLYRQHPRTCQLLLPTCYKEVVEIQPDETITAAFNRIFYRQYLGSQYEWLARYCKEIKNKEVELGVYGGGNIDNHIGKFTIQKSRGRDSFYMVDQKYRDTDEYQIFGCYHFPLFALNKSDMLRISKAEGFDDLMDLTWFCHHPTSQARPCGVCHPCVYAMKAGMGYRIPFWGRIRYYLRVSSRLEHLLRKYPKLYLGAKKIKNKLFPKWR